MTPLPTPQSGRPTSARLSRADPMYEAVERASESDRLWFERHPHSSPRLRLRIPGEFGPEEAAAGSLVEYPYVCVVEVHAGVRLRRPVSGPCMS